MGGQIGLLRDPDQLLQKYLPHFSYSKALGSARMAQTVMCSTQDEGQIVCKFFLEDLSAGIEGHPAILDSMTPAQKWEIQKPKDMEVVERMRRIQERFDLLKHPNVLVLVLERIEEKVQGQARSFFFAYRQFVYYSLQEKMRNRIPKLSLTEKKWFILQLLCGVSQIHQEGMVHGDIKPENILVTSYNQLFLTDLVSYKPSHIQDEDLTHYNLYFGELDNNQRCYFAPERLREQQEYHSLKGLGGLERAMDIFSAGCVIAEILMDGSPLFDLARLQRYRGLAGAAAAYSPRADLERKVRSPVMVDLIMKMIELDPSKRPSINDCLLMWNQQVLPHSFSKVFFQLSSSFVRPQYLFSDMKISLLRKFMPSIWRGCFDSKLATREIQKKFFEPIERIIFEKLREDNILEHNSVLIPSSSQFEFLLPQDQGQQPDFEISEDDRDSAIILVHWIGTFIGTCFFPQTRRCALEMLLVIARASSLEIRLQYILPYVFKMFDDKQSKVQAKAIEVAVLMFENIIDSDQSYILTSTDFKVFDNYIMPQFNKLQKSQKDDQLVQVTYTRYLPLLAKIGRRFTELSVTSRLVKKQHQIQHHSGSRAKQAPHDDCDDEEAEEEAKRDGRSAQAAGVGGQFGNENAQDKRVEGSDGAATSYQRNLDEEEEKTGSKDFISEADSRRTAASNKFATQASVSGEDNANSEAPPNAGIVTSLADSAGNQEARGDDLASMSQASQLHADHVEVFVNYDQEIDSLRKTFVSVISDYAVRQDTSIERLLFSSLGSLCDFFGSKVTMDNLIPLLGTCSNKREFLIKLECLKSVTGVGIKVGKQTLSQYMLPIYTQFLHDSEELVVLEIIKTLSQLLKLRLISKATLLDALQSKSKESSGAASHHRLDRLLPFLLHPNTWIREETLNFILVLSDHENTKLLTKAEVFCVIRKELKPYLRDAESANLILLSSSTARDLLPLLRTPLSRNTFESMVKTDHKKFEHQQQLKHSETDKYALGKLSDVIARTQGRYQQDSQMRTDQKSGNRRPSSSLWRRGQHYNQYRVVKVSTLLALAQVAEQKVADGAGNKRRQDRLAERNTSDYYNEFFEPCKQVQASAADTNNYGINSRTDAESKQLTEIDMVMQALGLLPDDPQIPLIDYTDAGLFSRLADQSLPADWRLQLEKTSSQVAQPSEMPQFHQLYSRTTSVPIDAANSKFTSKNTLCEQRSATEKFRPQGRLITTLHEHKNPVNSIAVTDDHSMFFTASRQDGIVHGWSTKDIERDVTSHSRFTIESQRQVNQICTLSNSEYFCVAGTQGGVDIYEMARLSQESSAKVPNAVYRNASLPGQRLPTHTAIVKTLEHADEGDMMNCLNTMLPVSHQHLLAYSSQRGSLFLHDLRCRRDALQQRDTFAQQRGMITCMVQGQDPYQLLCGSIGGYVMVYDIRFNVVSSSFKHNQKYPINSIAAFKPQVAGATFNRSTAQSPMALVAAGGPAYELSLLNLDTGNIEILMSANEDQSALGKEQLGANAASQATGISLPSFYRESLIRDCFSWPEKSETNQSLYRRYLMQTQSLVSPQQIKLTQNLDDELFKASRNRYKQVKQANESMNACRTVLIPRRYSNLLQGTLTADYAITGGNDMRLRYWSLTDPARGSYFVNTPNNDECQYFSEIVGGGVQCVKEQMSRVKNFPAINANMLHPLASAPKAGGRMTIPNTDIEMRSDSVYYSILANMIQSNNTDEVDLSTHHNARKYLSQSSLSDLSSGPAHQYQVEVGRDKITVYNYNGLSEWQHLNGLCGNEGNATLYNSTYNDMWSQGGSANAAGKQGGPKGGKKDGDAYVSQPYRSQSTSGDQKDQGADEGQDYLFRESHNVSHSDTILDMAILEVDQSPGGSSSSSSLATRAAGQTGSAIGQSVDSGPSGALPLLITCSRDCTIKLWR